MQLSSVNGITVMFQKDKDIILAAMMVVLSKYTRAQELEHDQDDD